MAFLLLLRCPRALSNICSNIHIFPEKIVYFGMFLNFKMLHIQSTMRHFFLGETKSIKKELYCLASIIIVKNNNIPDRELP